MSRDEYTVRALRDLANYIEEFGMPEGRNKYLTFDLDSIRAYNSPEVAAESLTRRVELYWMGEDETSPNLEEAEWGMFIPIEGYRLTEAAYSCPICLDGPSQTEGNGRQSNKYSLEQADFVSLKPPFEAVCDRCLGSELDLKIGFEYPSE